MDMSEAAERVKTSLTNSHPEKFAPSEETSESPSEEQPPEQDVLEGEEEFVEDETPRGGDLNEALRQERDRRRAAERSAETLRRDLEAAKKKGKNRGDIVEAVLASERPDDFDEWPVDRQTAWLSGHAAREEMRSQFGDTAFDEMRAMMLEHKVFKEMPNLNGPQIEAVASMLEKSSGALSIRAAHAAAKAEDPSVFADRKSGGRSPGQPMVQEPSRSQRRRAPADPVKSKREAVFNAESASVRRKAATAYVKELMSPRKSR